MVGDFGEVQVMDWGLAKIIPPERMPSKSTRDLTQELSRLHRGSVDRTLEENVLPYGKYVPYFVGFAAMVLLSAAMQLAAWVLTGLLVVTFRLLTSAGITRINIETREVQRITIS